MKILLVLCLSIILGGCDTFIKIKPYPDAPKELMVKAESLKSVPDNTSLTVLSTTITENYSSYHIVAERLRLLQEWTIKVRKESMSRQ